MPTEEERAATYRQRAKARKAFVRVREAALRGSPSAYRALLDRTKAARRDELSWRRPDD